MAYSETMDTIVIEDTRTGRKMIRYVWSDGDETGLRFVKAGTLEIRQLKLYETIIERICAYNHNLVFRCEIPITTKDDDIEYIQEWHCTKCDYSRDIITKTRYYEQQ